MWTLIVILVTAQGTERTERVIPDAVQCERAMDEAIASARRTQGKWDVTVRCEPKGGL